VTNISEDEAFQFSDNSQTLIAHLLGHEIRDRRDDDFNKLLNKLAATLTKLKMIIEKYSR
jgi:hypothetical protein